MRKYIWLFMAGAACSPALLGAQRPPARPAARPAAAAQAAAAKNEFGVDLGLAYVSPDGSDGRLRIGTPLDLRIGFVSRGRLMWEGRVGLAFDSEGLGDAAYAFTPQVMGLYSMTPQRHRAGMYLFGGAGLNFVSIGSPLADAGTTVSLGAGVGTRKRLGNAALRLEGGLRYDTEDTGAGMPSQFSIGARAGLSFWH